MARMSPLSLVIVAMAMMASSTLAFAPIQKSTCNKITSLNAYYEMPPAMEITVQQQQQQIQLMSSMTSTTSSSTQLTEGLNNYLASSSVESSTQALSLKERPPPPTKEELAAKQRNFNLWFWGGGFVAPFLATFYYFGFKFWEK